MRGTSSLRSKAVACTVGILASAAMDAQTAVWTGGGGANTNFSHGANWMSGSPPPNDGTNTVDLTQTSNGSINVNSAASVAGIVFLGMSGLNQYGIYDAGGSLSIGSEGISVPNGAYANLYLTAAIVLSQNQTWSLGFINQYASSISGPGSLTTTGSDYIFSSNTFTGGLDVASGSFNLGNNTSAGTGPITVEAGATLSSYTQPITLSNNVTLESNATLSNGSSSNPLTLSGTVTAGSTSETVNLAHNTSVTLSGSVTGPAGTDYTFAGSGSLPVVDGGSQLILSGALSSSVTGVTADNLALVLAPTTADPLMSYPGLSSGFRVSNGGYLGLDGTFTTPGKVASFFTTYGSTLAASIDGTIGFDNVENPGSPNTFSDDIDLSAFQLYGGTGNFRGLGSSTQAILTGSISPTSDNYYVFGGGGGTLTVTSDLEDHSGTSLVMTSAPSPLTLILQGANDYTGGVVSHGGVLIFDSTVLPGAGQINLNGGYVGYTEVPALSSAAFIALFANYGQGVIGFDQHAPAPSSPRQIGDAIDMAGFNVGSNVFLGTSTAAEFTAAAVITPANHNYEFTGVKGGQLTIDTQLNDGTNPNSVTIGLVNPIESNGSTSVVNITGNNTYSGGTTFNSGTIFINSDTAFGTNTVTISDTPGANISPYLASYGGLPVTISNPIAVGAIGSGVGVTLGNVAPSGSDMLVLNGVISDNPSTGPGIVGIGGPVTLGAMNTYSGGTIFNGNGYAEALITNSMAFGTGPATVEASAVVAPLGADVTLTTPFTLEQNNTLTLGQSGNTYRLTMNGSISGFGNLDIESNVTLGAANSYTGTTYINDANVIIAGSGTFGSGAITLNESSISYSFPNPTMLDLSGTDPNSAVALTSGQTLTLDADGAGGNYAGQITGDVTNSVVKIDTGTQFLSGNSTYGGGTTVSAGTLVANSSAALGTGPITVASGAQLGVGAGATLTQPITLSGNSTLSGSGTFSPAADLTFSSGDTVMPGFANNYQYVATLSFGNNVIFGTSGAYQFDIENAAGSAGVDYSTINIGGTLTVSSTLGQPFAINVYSISPGTGGLGPANFSSMVPYSWTILTATGGINGFSPSLFTINSGSFQPSLGGGSLTLAQVGDTLTLDFTPVPEPSTWVLLLGGVGTLWATARRRRARTAG